MAGHAGIVDDGAATIFQHHRDFVTHRIENAPNVDVENAAVFSFSGLVKRAFPFDPRIVEGNVETAELIDGEIDHRFHVRVFRDVGADKRRVPTELFNFGNDLRAFFLAAPSQNDLRTGASELDSSRLADAGCSTGHERDFA
jgi:hypothetical protein